MANAIGRAAVFAAACVAVQGLAGCKETRQTAQMAGKVTFRGQPVPEGFINFTPDVAGGNRGEIRGFRIKDGAYDTAAGTLTGVYPGSNIVTISGFDGKAKKEWPLGVQIFNPFDQTVAVADGKATKDFEVPEAAGKNVRIEPTADP